MSRPKVLLHKAIVEFSLGTPRSIFLTNIGDAPVHLTKGYVVGTATAYSGPLHVVADEEPGAVLKIGLDTLGKPDEDAEASRRAEEGIDEGQPPPHPPEKTYPKPHVHWEGVPDAFRSDVDDLLEEYKALWAGQLGKVDVTPSSDRGDPRGTTAAAPTLPVEPRLAGVHREGGTTATGLQGYRALECRVSLPRGPDPTTRRDDAVLRSLSTTQRGDGKDVYLLPRMDDCIEFLGDAKVFSTLDCNLGYWQIPVADEDRDKTTFVCHEGAYCCNRLPFGLLNAPATFQRAIDMILGGLKWKSCLVYLDDIIVFSQLAGEHVEHLREVFEALRGAGVSLTAKKCHLFQEEGEYLGHIVGRGQLQVQDKNIRGLKEASPPRCKKDLRSLLGMWNVYRRFVNDYAQVARPLAAMTSSKRPD